jgi:hypothetical protein
VVVARVRALHQWVEARPLRVVAEAYGSQAPVFNPLVPAGITVLRRWRKDAVGWDESAPVLGKRPRGRPRKQGRAWKLARLGHTEPRTALVVISSGTAQPVHVVWRDVWRRDVTWKVRVVAIATPGEPIRLVRTDRWLPPAVSIPLSAARVPLELAGRDRKPYLGLGDDPCQSLLAIHRVVHLAMTACCVWRLTWLRDQQAPWLTAAHAPSAAAWTPRSCQRLHRALRRFVRQRIFAASARRADWQQTDRCDEQVFRLAA